MLSDHHCKVTSYTHDIASEEVKKNYVYKLAIFQTLH